MPKQMQTNVLQIYEFNIVTTMITCIIAEKPSVARDIARIVGPQIVEKTASLKEQAILSLGHSVISSL